MIKRTIPVASSVASWILRDLAPASRASAMAGLGRSSLVRSRWKSTFVTGGMYADDENNPPESILKVDDSVTVQYKVKYIQSQESLRAERIPIVSVRHNEDGTTTSYARLHRTRMQHHIEDPAYYKEAVFPADPLPFPVTIATDCSDPEDHISTNARSRRPAPNRIGPLPFESDSSADEENALGSWDDLNFNEDDDTPPPNYQQRRVQGMTLAEAAEASQLATQEAVQAVGGKLLRPHAKFFIEKGKNRCTITFDPPVTGRFILLKMYHPSENIDIQGVYAKGFAGPRYFPSVELR
ncbi:hypothetical protein N0V93_004809 [Gnomoniopsis smithogilvyi]|uniref:Uncharacterized protein n=1 Tax=Gnomoniopsis smithogilvyi TaxID=1191159 RepID=A0A9W8YRQ3_9PEZI|nr:hypothetical protein N0V93_004809 [Gnomoniopsis smithogilvyi]